LTEFDEIGQIRDLWQIFDEICNERKMTFLAAKSVGDLEKALSHKFNHVTF